MLNNIFIFHYSTNNARKDKDGYDLCIDCVISNDNHIASTLINENNNHNNNSHNDNNHNNNVIYINIYNI